MPAFSVSLQWDTASLARAAAEKLASEPKATGTRGTVDDVPKGGKLLAAPKVTRQQNAPTLAEKGVDKKRAARANERAAVGLGTWRVPF